MILHPPGWLMGGSSSVIRWASTIQGIRTATPLQIPPFLTKASKSLQGFSDTECSFLIEKINEGTILSTLKPKQYKTILLLTKLKRKIPTHMCCKDLTVIPPVGLPPKHLTTTKKTPRWAQQHGQDCRSTQRRR